MLLVVVDGWLSVCRAIADECLVPAFLAERFLPTDMIPLGSRRTAEEGSFFCVVSLR
jgi:hypothetical protein